MPLLEYGKYGSKRPPKYNKKGDLKQAWNVFLFFLAIFACLFGVPFVIGIANGW